MRAAGAILDRQTFNLDAEDIYQGIRDVDMVPSLSAQSMQCIKIGKIPVQVNRHNGSDTLDCLQSELRKLLDSRTHRITSSGENE